MFRRLLFSGVLLLFVLCRTNGQSMDTITRQLFFQVYSGRPDTSITGFIKIYLPSLAEKKKNPGEWIRYENMDTLHAHEELHTFIFHRHPYFKEKFAQGRLEIGCKRYESQQLLQNITSVRLWFEFDLQQEAEIAFTRLVEMLSMVSTDKKFGTGNGSQNAAFLNAKDKTGFHKVQLRLMADNTARHKYKILFESGNDM
jgi:hypothetical protein